MASLNTEEWEWGSVFWIGLALHLHPQLPLLLSTWPLSLKVMLRSVFILLYLNISTLKPVLILFFPWLESHLPPCLPTLLFILQGLVQSHLFYRTPPVPYHLGVWMRTVPQRLRYWTLGSYLVVLLGEVEVVQPCWRTCITRAGHALRVHPHSSSSLLLSALCLR